MPVCFKKNIFFLFAFLFAFFSCSLNYKNESAGFKTRPNFVFKNSTLDRYKDDKLELRINFKELEIYDNDKIWVGEKIYFLKVDKRREQSVVELDKIPVESKGFAGLIKIDDKQDKYFLGEKVFFEDVKEKINISGEAFFWDKQNNILYATEDDFVRVTKGYELDIKGKGFIANTGSKEFEFTGSIEGKIKNIDSENLNSNKGANKK